MKDWKPTLLGKIGKDIRNTYKPNKEISVPYIGYEHIDQQTLLLIGIGKSNETQSDKKKFKSGDIIFGTLRPYFRKVIIPKFDGVCSTDLAVIRANDGYNQNFLYYILASQPLIDYADVSSNGTKMPRAKWNVLAKTEWLVPKLPNQHRIASILAAYDDLIEVNNQRIKLLEETARELYKEWFVRLRFPGYKKAKFVKGVPEGIGEVKYFKDFIKLNRGFDLPEEKIKEGNYPVIASTSIKGYHNQFKVKGPIITTGRSGTLGTVLFVNQDGWPLNTSLYVKDFKGNEPLYVYYTLKLLDFESFNSGAGVPTLNQNHLHKLKMWVADESLQKKFKLMVEPMFQKVEILRQQNTQLRQIRDRLLPRLISGKLEVKDK